MKLDMSEQIALFVEQENCTVLEEDRAVKAKGLRQKGNLKQEAY